MAALCLPVLCVFPRADRSSFPVLRAGLSRHILPPLRSVRYSTVPALRPSHSLSISPPERQQKLSTRGVIGMRVFIIDTSNMGPELQGGLIGVVGSVAPTSGGEARLYGNGQPVREGWVGDRG